MIRFRPRERGAALRAAMRATGNWWISRTGTDYKFIRALGGGEFLSYDWRVITTGIPGSYLNLNQLGLARVGLPMLSVDDREGTYNSLTTWTTQMAPTATQGYQAITVAGTIASGLLTRFTATAGAGTFKATDKGRRITVPGGSSVGGDLVVLISTVAADGSYVTWSSPNGVVGTYTATLHASSHRSNTVGDTFTWTSGAGVTSLAIRRWANTSGGLAKATIDGSATAANWLPTAQDKVTAGEYSSTILVANGGTLNPTDRVLDFYSGSTTYDDPLVIADGLTPGAHTVVLTVTGYTHTGGINSYVQPTGMGYGTGAETPTTAGAEILGTFAWQTGVSAHERAYRFGPQFQADGTTVNPNYASKPIDYYGRVHGYENQVSIAFTIDGVSTTITDGTTVAVTTSAVITQVSEQYHPDNAPAKCADHTTVYTLDAEGMTVEHTDTWRVPGAMWGGYPVMLPMASGFDRYTNSGLFQRLTINAGDGSHKGDGAAWTAVSWQAVGKYAQSVELTAGLAALNTSGQNPAMDRWWMEDRAPSSGVKINKQYMPWLASPTTPKSIANGEVWHLKSRYRFKRFASAEAVLGSL